MDRYGLTADEYEYIVGAGITVMIGSRSITISCDDLTAFTDPTKGFNFALDAPVVFPTVKECYESLANTEPFKGNLPSITWEGKLAEIGGLQATIDTFEIDTRPGSEKFVLAISFKFKLELLFLTFTEANFAVKRVKKEA